MTDTTITPRPIDWAGARERLLSLTDDAGFFAAFDQFAAVEGAARPRRAKRAAAWDAFGPYVVTLNVNFDWLIWGDGEPFRYGDKDLLEVLLCIMTWPPEDQGDVGAAWAKVGERLIDRRPHEPTPSRREAAQIFLEAARETGNPRVIARAEERVRDAA